MLLYNGQLLSSESFTFSLPNRGLFFNDGFFETMVWAHGSILYLPHHLHRLHRAAAALHFALPPALVTADALLATLQPLADTFAQMPCRLRLQLWRQGGGLYTPTTSACEWLVTGQPFTPLETQVERAAFAEKVSTQPSPVSFCKGPNALTYVLAAQERAQRNLDDVVLLSPAGYVAETVSAAVGWLREHVIYVPAAATGCVAGVRLAHLRTIALALGFGWQEGLYLPADLLAAEAVFTANIAGLRPVQQLGDTLFSSNAHVGLHHLRLADRHATPNY
ncbi:aminotransferase class IV [Hymenobacter mucosus]|uniref:Branched-chain amino acid aminotransferase/4-amino-4-deoxychorismate lyase n=1 Tax=Hymenobacter mucosus TaxID=1411120 RepID=A0A238V424_9BACT|nr:aminotransferase class IV [Hymenobacter mucosus]SNR29215.1 branched-chain amino acid aminotransferase/4-amino-4-deoxychorismate lyase [Hymenobacter mucosus]